MSLKAFLKQNAKPQPNKKEVITERFLDDDGNPEIWEIRPILEKENAVIKEECTHRDYSKSARKSGASITFDSTGYVRKLCALSVVYPDLSNAELQASYGVVGAEDLLGVMLYSHEFAKLQEIVDSFDGVITKTMEDAKEEVKNS